MCTLKGLGTCADMSNELQLKYEGSCQVQQRVLATSVHAAVPVLMKLLHSTRCRSGQHTHKLYLVAAFYSNLANAGLILCNLFF